MERTSRSERTRTLKILGRACIEQIQDRGWRERNRVRSDVDHERLRGDSLVGGERSFQDRVPKNEESHRRDRLGAARPEQFLPAERRQQTSQRRVSTRDDHAALVEKRQHVARRAAGRLAPPAPHLAPLPPPPPPPPPPHCPPRH